MRAHSGDQGGVRGSEFERLLAEVFRKAGWKVESRPKLGLRRPDLLVRHEGVAYAVELKSAPEGRRDRLIPVLAKAILQAQAVARDNPEIAPLAIVASSRVPESIAGEIQKFASEYAPGVAVGVMDLEGFRFLVGRGLEVLNARRERRPLPQSRRTARQQNLFSDLNQWMLKVLLAPRVPESLLSAPRGQHRSVSEFARAASVSVMSASRFARLLRADGFLDESSPNLQLVRLEELMDRWRAVYAHPAHEWPMRWILRGNRDEQLDELFRRIGSKSNEKDGRPSGGGVPQSPRVCLGLFAAADLLGVGVVHGVVPHIYVESLASREERRMGLMQALPGQSPDVYLRIPAAEQSIFRAAVPRGKKFASDIIQVWLDVSGHPARGQEQALEIERRTLRSLFQGS